MPSTGSIDSSNAGSHFEQYFEIVPAVTPALRDEVFRIRHQVYCEDLGFEPVRQDRRETDEYDAQSLHLLMRSVKTGEFAGCTRLILARADDPQALMPFERACAESLDRSIIDPAALPRVSIGEISRLSVVAAFRKRKGEMQQAAPLADSDFGTPPRPRFPYILVGLYLGVVELARLHGIKTLFVLTEPRLANHLGRIGVEIKPIGAAIEHHGTRIPSVMQTNEIIDNLKPLFRPLYASIAKEVAPVFPGA
ncbi:MAG: family N-acetyltransferase [Betaproteobacteria bacterium]|nr:family N-acetyltransferase [Betaproteobacteria bacterium]